MSGRDKRIVYGRLVVRSRSSRDEVECYYKLYGDLINHVDHVDHYRGRMVEIPNGTQRD